ncbi:hypothetical protein ACTSEZ_07755 [Metabacillus sp. JX24]|uniref:hypothetical protein n=1 Tax=Metabacillus sp. JX24 TaxID=3240759 RepID=UPI00350F2F4E
MIFLYTLLACFVMPQSDASDIYPLQPTSSETQENYQLTEFFYHHNQIAISYPQLSGIEDSSKQEKLNKNIKTDALTVLHYYPDGAMTDGLTLDIKHTIKRMDRELLSIQYDGLANVSGTAHPSHHFYTSTYLLTDGSRVKLKQLVTLNEAFAETLKKKSKALSPALQGYLEELSNQDLLSKLQTADQLESIGENDQSDVFSYWTEDSLGISIGVSHSQGDHAEYEVKTKDIVPFLKKPL